MADRLAAKDRYMVIPTDAAYVVVKVMSLHDSVAEAALEVKRLKAGEPKPLFAGRGRVKNKPLGGKA